MTTILVAIGYLGSLGFVGTLASLAFPGVRSAIWKYMAGRIQFSFDEKLERIRSDLRQTEQKLEGELQSSNSRINSVTQTVLSVRSSRQTALDARRLAAVDRLWETKAKLDYAKFVAQTALSLKMDVAAKRASKDPAVKQFFEVLDKASPFAKFVENKESVSIERDRPFLSPAIWTTFQAYSSILMFAVTQVKVLATSPESADLLQTEHVSKLLKSAIPEHTDYIEKYGTAGWYQLLDILEEKLLVSINQMLDGEDSDVMAVARATSITRLATSIVTPSAKLADKIPSGLEINDSVPEPESSIC